ncbi:MAG: VCBS repeat-containing protein [Pirellulaceae bacterium]
MAVRAGSGWLDESTKILDGRFDELAALDANQDGADEIYQPQVRGWLRMDQGHWIGHIGNYDSSDTTFANAFDYDNDGDLDLGYSTRSGGYFSENIARTTHELSGYPLSFPRRNMGRGSAGFGQRENDIVTASRRTLFLHFNIGSETFNTNRPERQILFDHNVLPALADLNHDGWTDLLVATNGQVRWFANSATGLADESQLLAESDVADALAFHSQDIDGNGEIDFLLEGVSDTQILLANGGSYVRAPLPGTDLKFAERDLDGSAKILSIGVHGQLQISSVTQDLAVTTSVIHRRYSRPVAADFDQHDGRLGS